MNSTEHATTGFNTAYDDWHVLENWRGTSAMASAALNIHKPAINSASRVVCHECGTGWPCNAYAAMEKAAGL